MTIKKIINNSIEGFQIIDEKGEHFEPLINSPTEEMALAKFTAMRLREANPPPPSYQELRAREYLAQGITEKEMIVALWEWQVEGRKESKDLLQTKRETVKAKYPKV